MLKLAGSGQSEMRWAHVVGRSGNASTHRHMAGGTLRNESSHFLSRGQVRGVWRQVGIKELDRVELLVRLTRAGNLIMPGATGTVIYIHRDGEAYEVEFNQPHFDVITLRPSEITRLDG